MDPSGAAAQLLPLLSDSDVPLEQLGDIGPLLIGIAQDGLGTFSHRVPPTAA